MKHVQPRHWRGTAADWLQQELDEDPAFASDTAGDDQLITDANDLDTSGPYTKARMDATATLTETLINRTREFDEEMVIDDTLYTSITAFQDRILQDAGQYLTCFALHC